MLDGPACCPIGPERLTGPCEECRREHLSVGLRPRGGQGGRSSRARARPRARPGHEPPVETWAPPDELVTPLDEVEDEEDDEPVLVLVVGLAVAEAVGAVAVEAAVDPWVDAMVEVVTGSVVPASLVAASQPSPPVAATPANAVPMVMVRKRRIAGLGRVPAPVSMCPCPDPGPCSLSER